MTGFSGSGKTSIGMEVASRLGRQFLDTDEEVARIAGKSIESIFAEDGEDRFRLLERRSLQSAAARDRLVVSTGGGIVIDEGNRSLMTSRGVIVCLEARPETIHARLKAQSEDGDPTVRPMLSGEDPLVRIRELKAERQFSYSLADWTVHTDGLTVAGAAAEVVRGWSEIIRVRGDGARSDGDVAAVVRTSAGDYPVWVGWGLLDRLGERVKQIVGPSTAYIITDEGVYQHARRAQGALETAGIPTHMFLVPPGEQSKTEEMAGHIYGWLAGRRAERGHLVLAVGGGVVGDLAGFVAATYLRGMPFGQVPTSLLAMMDASIGGKVAIDLPQGKNLVGAFHQPRFVLADVEVLKTLPQRELASGWAEAIKHGLILDEDLLATFETQRDSIRALEPEVATEVIRRSVAIKARIVSQDERETMGIRVLLNYGHTIGHAIEAATGYREVLHGEAVSVGMMGAAFIGNDLGLTSDAEVDRQRAVLEGFGLPVSREFDIEAVIEAMRSDKKTAAGSIRWVLLDGIGRAVTRSEVHADLVRNALKRLAQ